MTTAIGAYATSSLVKSRLGITDTTDDTVLGTICDQINQYIETRTERVVAPISSATYLYDGDGSRSLYLPITADGQRIGGLRAITLMEVAAYTGGAYATLASTQFFLRQKITVTGPFERLEFTDYPTGLYSCWPKGYATVRITATAGWAAIPDDITELALTAATRAWHAVQAGQSDIVGTDEMGRPLVSRFFSARDLETLNKYGVDIPA